jgi:hypothetical protein
MSFSLTISDGTTTVTLSATDALLVGNSYQQRTPAAGALTVSEQAEVVFINTPDTTLYTLERLFAQARDTQYRGSSLAKVYLTLTLDGVAWRSEITDGRVVISPDFLRHEHVTNKKTGSVMWTRLAYWEGAEVLCLLTNGNGTDSNTALNVYNCNDAVGASPNKRNNFVSIPAIGGDMPTPAIVELESAAAGALGSMVLALGWRGTPASFTHMLEIESGTAAAGVSKTNTADAGCSGGNYGAITGLSDVEEDIISWALDTNQLAYAGGGTYRIVMRWKALPVNYDIYLKVSLRSGTVKLFEWSPVFVEVGGSQLYTEIGSLVIPPYVLPGNAADINLHISGWFESGHTETMNMDAIYMIPADSYRLYTALITPASGQKAYEDGVRDRVYGTISGEVVQTHIPTGDLLMLMPNKAHRLHYIGLAGTITDYVKVKVWYRPRRRVVA